MALTFSLIRPTVEELSVQVAELRQMVLSMQTLITAQQDEIGALKRAMGRVEREHTTQCVGSSSSSTTPSKNGLVVSEGVPMVHRSGTFKGSFAVYTDFIER
jgi:hypothetical protein